MRKQFFSILLILLCLFSIGFSEEITSAPIVPDPTIILQPDMSVIISSDRKSSMRVNEIVHLTSILTGFEWCEEIKYQWECDKNDGNGFQPINGAIQSHYEFPATSETLSWSWRLTVYYR